MMGSKMSKPRLSVSEEQFTAFLELIKSNTGLQEKLKGAKELRSTFYVRSCKAWLVG